ncbi:MAG: hypothetical protein OXF41_21610 [bacterium]|nr:hypothetical protein [bacterium]
MLVAVVDDIPDELEALAGELEEAGHQVLLREMPIQSVDSLVMWLQTHEAEALLCDQRLSVSGYATFRGAEAIRRVVRSLRLPCLLVSSYLETELLEIRRWRADIPVVIGKEQLTPENINDGFRLCSSELRGDVPTQRVSRRTGVYIESLSTRPTGIIDVIVPGWDESRVISLPLDLISDPSLREEVRQGYIDWLVAGVNVDAERSADLFFRDFERSPNPEGIWEKLTRS